MGEPKASGVRPWGPKASGAVQREPSTASPLPIVAPEQEPQGEQHWCPSRGALERFGISDNEA